jgi:putative SOS response-associated peptidase YedK
MCGRYGLTIEQEAVAAAFGVSRLLTDHRPRYNVAPSQTAPVILQEAGSGRSLRGFRWGLVPFWAEDPAIGNRMINARSETVQTKPAFRGAWKDGRRCLIPATGFYEWQPPATAKGPKVPYWIRMADERPFGFAGIWERWDRGGEPLFTFTVLTTDANDLLRPIHDRMPVILGDARGWELWLDPKTSQEEAATLLAPYPAEEMQLHPVSTYVNRPANEGPTCIERVNAPAVLPSPRPRRRPDVDGADHQGPADE